ncbi:hypothetical protein Peur_056628 [Populus x canadensis]
MNSPAPSQTKRQLLLEDGTPLHSSATAVATDPPSGSISLDHGAISDANDPVTKRHRPFKHVSDGVILLLIIVIKPAVMVRC